MENGRVRQTKEIFSFMLQACHIVHVANQRGLEFTHRDFHPGNIMCKKNGKKPLRLFNGKTIRPKYKWLFIDFGMSCITRFGACSQEEKVTGIFLPPQEDTPYSEDANIFCGSSSEYDMKLFFHAVYDNRDDMISSNKKTLSFLESWLDSLFGDTSWHDSYNQHSDESEFSPSQCMKRVWAYASKQNLFK